MFRRPFCFLFFPVLLLFRLEVQSLLFASGFQFFNARRLRKPLRFLLFDAQPLFGRDPFKPRRLRFRLLTRKHRLAVGFQILFHVEEEQDDRAKHRRKSPVPVVPVPTSAEVMPCATGVEAIMIEL